MLLFFLGSFLYGSLLSNCRKLKVLHLIFYVYFVFFQAFQSTGQITAQICQHILCILQGILFYLQSIIIGSSLGFLLIAQRIGFDIFCRSISLLNNLLLLYLGISSA